ncbi:MAG TPA: beta-propeller fold lactonase family protein, partial [Gemmatimonadaceae bacterium]|nr:beta-propeller fold lactonase family protein [Gemmatimonadaceae bacterium]
MSSREPSRREFLAASLTGLVMLARNSENLAMREGTKLDSDLLYVGTYTDAGRTDGIHLLRMDRRTGKLDRVASVDSGPNPSFLAIHPNGRTLY